MSRRLRIQTARQVASHAGGSATVRSLVGVLGLHSPDRARHVLAAMTEEQAHSLTELARVHRIEAWLAGCAPVELPQWHELADQRLRFLAMQARQRQTAADCGRILSSQDCPWAVVKGLALAATVYPRTDLRYGLDLDLLVPPDRFEQAIQALQSAGYELIDRNWPMLERIEPGELRLRSHNGIVIDLHWSVMNEVGRRELFHLPTTELLARTRPITPELFGLDDVDALITVGVHAASSGANRLSWLLDCHLLSAGITSWQEVLVRARASHTAEALGLVLVRAQALFGTPLPCEAVSELVGGRGRLAIDRLVDRVSPVTSAPERGSLSASWARAVEASTIRSATHLAARGASWLRSSEQHTARSSEWEQPSNPDSALYDVPDAAAMRRYFAAVRFAT